MERLRSADENIQALAVSEIGTRFVRDTALCEKSGIEQKSCYTNLATTILTQGAKDPELCPKTLKPDLCYFHLAA